MTAPTPQSLLLRAADILDERGWTQGGFVGHGGSVCLMGAVNIAAAEVAGINIDRSAINGSSLPEPMWALREKSLRRLHESIPGIGFGGLGGWNDGHGRTKEQVQEMLRRAGGVS